MMVNELMLVDCSRHVVINGKGSVAKPGLLHVSSLWGAYELARVKLP